MYTKEHTFCQNVFKLKDKPKGIKMVVNKGNGLEQGNNHLLSEKKGGLPGASFENVHELRNIINSVLWT